MDPMQEFNEMYWTTLTPEQKEEYQRIQEAKRQAAQRAVLQVGLIILVILAAFMLGIALACGIVFFALQHAF